MGDYHDLYSRKYVLLLADVFEKLVTTYFEHYGLYPCHYFSSPGLSWNLMLKITKIELGLISDTGVHLFAEKGMRGGISYIGKRYSKANNKYIKSFDPNQPSRYISYLDANNLYVSAMSQYLLYDGFKWLSQKEIDKFDVNSISEDSADEYISEVDLGYPDELHVLHNDYPLAPEKTLN